MHSSTCFQVQYHDQNLNNVPLLALPERLQNVSSGKRPRSNSGSVPSPRKIKQRRCAVYSPQEIGDAQSSLLMPSGCATSRTGPTDLDLALEDLNKSLHPYAQDIHLAHLENEERNWRERPFGGLTMTQMEVNLNMRAILVDWLVEVADEYRLHNQTLFLAVNYVDRFLETMPVHRQTLQLVGITCLLIAAKYEEIFSPLIDDFVDITDNTYTRSEILRTELLILNALKFRLTVSTIHNFLTRYLLVAKVTNPIMIYHANYLAELTLPMYSFQQRYKPSVIAASIVCITNYTFNMPSWSSVFEAYTGYKPAVLRPCIHELYAIHRKISMMPKMKSAPREKYSKSNFGRVALYPLKPECPL